MAFQRSDTAALKAETGFASGAAGGSIDWSPLIAVGALMCLALALGGGGVRYALANLAVQLAALIILAVRSGSALAFWREAPLFLRGLVIVTVLVPAAQLIPLPETMWKALPGRELVAQTYELAGQSGWAPISVDRVRTTVALSGLIAPLAILAAGWTAPRPQLLLLGWLVVMLAMLNVLIGIPQVLSGGNSGALYEVRDAASILQGTFANRNSTGLFLVGALGFAAILPAPSRHPAVLPFRIGICLLLILGIVLTRSRTALVLAILPIALAGLRAIWWSRFRGETKPQNRSVRPAKTGLLLVLGSIALVIGAAAAALTFAPGRVNDTVERFAATSDARQYIWEDGAYSASRYWPAGSGMGTFDEVFQVDESLEFNTEKRAGRAHNDYLEVAIEAGAAGLTVIALWLALLVWLVWRVRRAQLRWTGWSAAVFLLAISLQSITDYPLRNQSMLVAASFALLLLARIANDPTERAR